MKNYIKIIFLGFILFACSTKPHQVMNQAEDLMNNNKADSAVILLRSLYSSENVLSSRAKGRHALLLTMAQDKAYIDVTDDSLAKYAYHYYNHHGRTRDKMLAAYYLAIIEARVHNDVEATIHFKQAEELATKIKDYHCLGYCQQKIAEIYGRNYDYEEYFNYSKKALKAFDTSGDTLTANLCRIYIAQYYRMNEQYEFAFNILDSLLHRSNSLKPLIKGYASLALGEMYYSQERWKQADSMYQQFSELGYHEVAKIIGNKAVIQEQFGQSQNADSLIQALKNRCISEADSTAFYTSLMTIHMLRNDYKTAFHELEAAVNHQNRAVTGILARSITHAQKNYWENHYYLEKATKHNQQLHGILIIISLLIVFLFFALALYKRKQELLAEHEAINTLKKDLRLLQQEQDDTGAIVNALLNDKINKLQRISTAYFNWTDEAISIREAKRGRIMKEEIIREFRNDLKSLREDLNFFTDIENALNHSREQLMIRLRHAVSHSTDISFDDLDYRLLSLFFANFSTKSISFIMDMTDDAVRKRKSRYKKQFVAHKEVFQPIVKDLL